MEPSELNRLSSDLTYFSQWMDAVNSKDVLNASTSVFQLTSAFKKHSSLIEPKNLYQIAISLTPKVLELTEILERLYLKNTSHTKVAQLNMAILRQLACLYLECADTLEGGCKLISLSHALQLQGMVHYQSVLSAQPPSASLWREMGRAYQYACQSGLCTTPLDANALVLHDLDTIDKIIKRNLLFAIANAYSFNASDIQALFVFCANLQTDLQLHQLGSDRKEGFCWEYMTEQLPYQVCAIKEDNHRLLFNTEAIAKADRLGQIDWPLSDPTHMLNQISHYRCLVNSTPPALPSYHVFTCGAERVFTFFQKHIRDGLVWMVMSPSSDSLNFSSLELYQEPSPIQKTEKIGRESIWGNVKQDKEKLAFNEFGAIKLFKTDVPGFYVFESIKLQLEAQDLMVVYGKDLRPYLAVVRRLELSNLQNIQKGLVEILQGKVSFMELPQGQTKEKAILLKQGDTIYLYLQPHKIDALAGLKATPYHVELKQLMEVRPHFMCYRVAVVG